MWMEGVNMMMAATSVFRPIAIMLFLVEIATYMDIVVDDGDDVNYHSQDG